MLDPHGSGNDFIHGCLENIGFVGGCVGGWVCVEATLPEAVRYGRNGDLRVCVCVCVCALLFTSTVMISGSVVVPFQKGPYFCRATRDERLGFLLPLVEAAVVFLVLLLISPLFFLFSLLSFMSSLFLQHQNKQEEQKERNRREPQQFGENVLCKLM